MDLYDKLYRRVQSNLKKQGKDVDLYTIEKCFRQQFKFVRKVMEEGNWYAVRLKYLGIFGVKTNRIKYTNKGEVRNQVIDAEKGDIVTVRTPSGTDIGFTVY